MELNGPFIRYSEHLAQRGPLTWNVLIIYDPLPLLCLSSIWNEVESGGKGKLSLVKVLVLEFGICGGVHRESQITLSFTLEVLSFTGGQMA